MTRRYAFILIVADADELGEQQLRAEFPTIQNHFWCKGKGTLREIQRQIRGAARRHAAARRAVNR